MTPSFVYSAGIPVRNEENTITQTIESLLTQTRPPKEILVCINGSTDKTLDRVKNISKKEKKVTILTSNPGKANAWHKIISHSLDDTILFCDGDVLINKNAAEEMCLEFEKEPYLALIGGANAYKTANGSTFFSKYCTEDLNGKPTKQGWVCGRLYMTKIKELYKLAKSLEIELMPRDIINEDGYLEMLTNGNRKIIDSAYNISMQVTTFHDWRIGLKRIFAGQQQLKERYPEYFGDSELSIKRLKNYIERFNQIKGIERQIGVTSLFVVRTMLNLYYKCSKLSYNALWDETKSTKVTIRYP